MINQINEQIRLWLIEISNGVDVSFCAPEECQKDDRINVYLISLEKMMGNTNPLVTQIKLKYLIFICSQSDEKAHVIMSRLLESGSNHSVFALVPETLPVEILQALKVIPQPVFALEYLMELPRQRRESPLVEQAPTIITTPLSSVYGVVLDDNNNPLQRCRLELKSYKRSVLSDYHGRFDLGLVSTSSPAIITIYTRSDNREYSFIYKQFDGQEITISLAKLEDSNA